MMGLSKAIEVAARIASALERIADVLEQARGEGARDAWPIHVRVTGSVGTYDDSEGRR